ncbi:hypothetical protein GCM10009682_32350 [Luedemannella flava]|uniref:DUF4265 domain-containing protein n=1 Tax=Luedemannella flava TaxID=349316 RepID=A0ABP4YBV9_9ACTN
MQDHDHVRLLAEVSETGQPRLEELPATRLGHDVYLVDGSPMFTYGCAAGDRIRVAEDGTFEVLERGGNLCLRVYPTEPLSEASVEALRHRIGDLDGLVETPGDRRFVVITAPVTAGFPDLQAVLDQWTEEHGGVWEYGNVYDEDNKPLDWWTGA